MKISIFILLFCLFFSNHSQAQEEIFASNAEEIISALLRTKPNRPKFKTRSIQYSKIPRARAIKIIKKNALGNLVKKEIALTTREKDNKINLKILFDFDSDLIRAESFNLLDELGIALSRREFKKKLIVISGHTDSDGDENYNLKLSYMRANAIRNYLVANHGVSSQLKVVGYGEQIPLVKNISLNNKQINRRVEISTAIQ